MKYYIITGASKGLGRALASQLANNSDNQIITISRSQPDVVASNLSCHLFDLVNIVGLQELLERIVRNISPNAEKIYLINNAGTVFPMGPLDQCAPEDIFNHFQLNTVAPVILSSLFVKSFKKWNCEKGIINVTSGAGKRPFFGWGCYCISKASLNMLDQCLSLENDLFKISAYDPGIIDTMMQDAIRSQKKEDFYELETFISFKEENKLKTPDEAAKQLMNHYSF